MEFRDLRSFVAIVESGSQSAAAAQLGYAVSSLTAHVQALERDLGVKLFEPGEGRRRRPTGAGLLLLPHALTLLEERDRALRSIRAARPPVPAQATPIDTIVIGASDRFAHPAAVAAAPSTALSTGCAHPSAP